MARTKKVSIPQDKAKKSEVTRHPRRGHYLSDDESKELRQRECLRCDREFLSEGPHNRLCGPCRTFLAANPPEIVYTIKVPRGIIGRG